MMMASLSAAWVLLSLAVRFTTAIPAITFPLNSQVPPVARIGQPFSFVFSESTFTSSFPIAYRLANPPTWLSIDSKARRLYGTPQDVEVPAGEVVGVPVTLIASDDTGSATLDATLVVSRDSSPSLEVPIDEQVPPFGTFSGPSSILAPPDAPFSFQVLSDTFSNPSNHPLNYYAVTLDHTPLPAWVTFDPTTLSFFGRTPPFESLIQPPQSFGLQLVASDVEGFSAASLEFTIVVGADTHHITATETVVVLNATAGEPVLYTKLRDDVKVDGQPATPDNSVIKSSANLPSWLTLDPTSWQIAGTSPESVDSTNFTVTLGDKFSNTLNITFVLEISGQTHRLLNGQLPTIDIVPGEEFSFDLAPFLTNPEDIEISVSGDLPSWIQINQDTKTTSGLVPLTLTPTDPAVELTIDLKSKSSSTTDSTQLTFSIANTQPSASSTVSTQPSASSTNSLKAPANDDQGNGSPALPVNTKLLAILLPVLLLVIALIILFIWWFRRRRREQQEQPRLRTREISEPLPGSFVVTAHGLPGSELHRELEEQRDGSMHSVRNDTFAAGAIATAVGDHEKKEPIESREIYQTTEGELMVRPLSTVRLIPSTERLRTAASNFLAKGRAASLGSRSAVSSRRGRPTRGNSTLSSISETTSHLLDGSLGTGVVRPGASYLDLPKHHNNSASSFRGDVEINIPALRDPSAPPESTYTGDESNWTDAPYASSPPGSSRGNSPRHSIVSDRSCEAPDVMAMPLRTASRQGHYPAAPTQKFSWPWNKKTAGGTSERTSRVSFFSRTGRINSNSAGMRHTSQQASLRSIPSVDTFAQQNEPNKSRRNKAPPAKNGPSHDRGDSNTTAGISFSGISFPRTPTLPELPRLPSLIRSPTKTGENPVTDDEDEEGDDRGSVRSSIIPGTIKTTTTPGKDITTTGRKRAATFDTGRDSIYTANDSVPGGGSERLTNSQKNTFIPDHSVWTATKGHSHDSLGIIYSDLVKKAPFHPSSSAFWSSPASRKGKEKQPAADNSSGILPPNWAILNRDQDRDSSPAPSHAIKGWGASSNLGAGDEDNGSFFGGGGAGANRNLQPQLMGSPMKSPRIGIDEAKVGSGGLRLVEPSSSIRGPPSEADVMSIDTVDYWKGRAGAPSTAGPGSSVMSVPRDMTPDRTHHGSYWNKLGLGGKMFTRGDREGVSWTADLGRHDRGGSSRVKKSRGKGRGAAGSVSRFSMISEVNGKEGGEREKARDKEKENDAAAAVSLASASKSSVGGSHYYI